MSKRVCFKVSDELARQLAAFRAIHNDSNKIDNHIAKQISVYMARVNAARGVSIELDSKTCPDCGAKMVERRKGSRRFLGCSSYPKCKKTLKIQE